MKNQTDAKLFVGTNRRLCARFFFFRADLIRWYGCTFQYYFCALLNLLPYYYHLIKISGIMLEPAVCLCNANMKGKRWRSLVLRLKKKTKQNEPVHINK